MKKTFLLSVLLLTLAVSAVVASYTRASQNRDAASLAGVWKGKFTEAQAVPAVEITLNIQAGKLAGKVVFYKVVNNGFGAGMLANEYHPDLIILDVMLPDINGQVVCELIRRDAAMSDIKIICISGMVEEEKIAELKQAGADDFLHKPLDIDELLKRICRLLDIESSATS